MEGFCNHIFESATDTTTTFLPVSVLRRRAKNSDELDPPFKWTWNEVTRSNNLPPRFIIMSHLPGEAKRLCVGITSALMRGRAGELLRIQRSATPLFLTFPPADA